MPGTYTMPFMADLEFRRRKLLFDDRRNPDIVWGVFQKALDDFNLYNLESNDLSVTIRMDPGARRVVDLQNSLIGYNRYFFESWTSDTVTMKVRIDKNEEPWVCAEGTWISFRHWLQQMAESQTDPWINSEDDSTGAVRRVLWDKQWRMWRSSDKKFPLVKLPAEIRVIFYGYVFDGGERSSCGRRYARLGKTDRWDRDRVAIQQPETNILQLNNQVYREASHILYEHTVFRITREHQLHHFLVRNSRLAPRIRRLEVALELTDFSSLFRAKVLRDRRGEPLYKAAKVFQHLKLKELVLEMEAPRETAPRITGNTWSLNVPCHRMCVDMILRAALPFVAGNAVTVSGYAKTKQKRDFEDKCAQKRKAHLDWCATMPGGYEAWTIADHKAWKREEDGGVRLDGCEIAAPEIAAEEGEDSEEAASEDENAWFMGHFMTKCECNVSCAKQTWNSDA